MNLIQALRLPNSQAVMTNIARFHYQNIYNVGLTPPIATQSNLTFQIKGYTRNYRFLRLDYACVIYIADGISSRCFKWHRYFKFRFFGVLYGQF